MIPILVYLVLLCSTQIAQSSYENFKKNNHDVQKIKKEIASIIFVAYQVFMDSRKYTINKTALVTKLDDNIKKNSSPLNSLQKYHPTPPNMVLNTVVAEMNLQEQTDAPVKLVDNDLEIDTEDSIQTADI